MSDPIDDALEAAEARAREAGWDFRGALTPDEAWLLVQEHPAARLVDIRSQPEWVLVGQIPGSLQIEYKRFPDWELNPDFVNQIRRQLSPDKLVLLVCRSGIRSKEAAELLTREGYSRVYNVLDGFEGERSAKGQRNLGGWKRTQLPWTQQ